MKRRLMLSLMVIALLFGGVTAMALAGTRADALISVEYLKGSFQSALLAQVSDKANESYEASYLAAEKRLLEEAARRTSDPLPSGSSQTGDVGHFTPRTLVYQDSLSLGSGSSILPLTGSYSIQLQGGELINLSNGSASAYPTLEVGQRYLLGEGATATVIVDSEGASLAVMGQVSQGASGRAALPFHDVARDDWFYESVRFVYEKKLFEGIDDQTFSPSGTVTRGMLATVLYRLAGEPTPPTNAPNFSDVTADAWYAKGVRWAASANIVKGMGGNQFAPNDYLTREQLALMLQRYATNYAALPAEQLGQFDRFADRGSISAWAEEGLAWAVGVEILGGDTAGLLRPGAQASRAETATMMQRFTALLPQ